MNKLTSWIKWTHIKGLGIGWTNCFRVLACKWVVPVKCLSKIGKADQNGFWSYLILSYSSVKLSQDEIGFRSIGPTACWIFLMILKSLERDKEWSSRCFWQKICERAKWNLKTPPRTFECTVLYYRALLALEWRSKGTACTISETWCDAMLSRKLQIACCVGTLQLKNVRMINSWLCSTSLYHHYKCTMSLGTSSTSSSRSST